MSLSKKRSRSDMDGTQVSQQWQPFLTSSKDQAYNMQVLNLDFAQTEDDLDHHFHLTALDLGLDIPQGPKATIELLTSNITDLTLSSPRPTQDSLHSLSSASTHQRSCSSSEEQPLPTKASSQTTRSIISAPSSVKSSSSKKTPYVKVRKGLRRLSTLARRRISSTDSSSSMLLAPTLDTFTTPPKHFLVPPERAQPVRSFSIPHNSVELPSVSSPKARPHTAYFPHGLPIQEMESDEMVTARLRSLTNSRLQGLRAQQLEEKGRFVRFETEQRSLMVSKSAYMRRVIVQSHKDQELELLENHSQALSALENRHLAAEMELVRALEIERRACDTRLKHMEGYCRGHSSLKGMPRRNVTDKDYRKLEQQYHVRAGMDNLHEARINVLREKQAKQLERVMAKQEEELNAATCEMNKRLGDVEYDFSVEEHELRDEFLERKRRILSRWKLMEAIERRKIENETGDEYGPLPDMEWSD